MFLNGEAAWLLMVALTTPQADAYLANCKAKGINYLEVMLVSNAYKPYQPKNAYNVAPFSGASFATPVEEYFADCDSIMNLEAFYGVYLDLHPENLVPVPENLHVHG